MTLYGKALCDEKISQLEEKVGKFRHIELKNKRHQLYFLRVQAEFISHLILLGAAVKVRIFPSKTHHKSSFIAISS